MKNLHKFLLPAAALVFTMTSCEPTETPEPETPQTTQTAPTPPQPTISGVNGAMIALDLDFNYTVAGISVPFNTEMGIAAFYNNPGDAAMVSAGTVKLNNEALTMNTTNNSYLVTAGIPNQAPSTLNLDGSTMSWSVSGAGSIPGVTGNYPYSLPVYSGTFPTDISKASGLTLNFSGNFTGADSVYVMIVSGSTNFLKSYAPSASITISSSDLSGITASSSTAPAYIEIVPWKVVGYQTIMGKTFAFVNERAYVRSVNVN